MRLTPVADNQAAITELRRVLDSAGYTLERIRPELLAVSRAIGHGPLATLIRLFFLRVEVSIDDARRALAPLTLDTVVALGLVSVSGEMVSGGLQIVPTGELILASDGDRAEPSSDHVMSPSGSTLLLAALTVRRHADLALDLGTGCGYQAILAARHAARVIATDLNPRALAFTAFNAALNGVRTIECRAGNWLEGVAEGERFDLIVCNPPYVIAPQQSVLYRDDPLGEGGSSRRLVETVARFLRPGGLAHVLTGWVHTADEHWSRPLVDWVSASGCDAWLFRYASYDPPEYAATWNAHLAVDPPRYADAIERWTRYFAQQGIQRLAEGGVVLRRRAAGMPRLSIDELASTDLDASAGDDLEARMVAADLLDELDDAALLQQRLEIAPAQRLDQVHRYRGDRFHMDGAWLVGERGLYATLACGPLLLRILATVDGQRTVAEVTQMAASADQRSAALEAVRQAVAHGALRLV